MGVGSGSGNASGLFYYFSWLYVYKNHDHYTLESGVQRFVFTNSLAIVHHVYQFSISKSGLITQIVIASDATNEENIVVLGGSSISLGAPGF